MQELRRLNKFIGKFHPAYTFQEAIEEYKMHAGIPGSLSDLNDSLLQSQMTITQRRGC